MLQCPIIFIREDSQTGTPFYGTKIAVECAVRHNPNGRVIFISDELNRTNLCEWHPIEKFSDSKRQFLTSYKPETIPDCATPHWWNLATLSPWLVLGDFCDAQNLLRACHLDTDVLCFCDVAAEFRHWWYQYDFTASAPEGSPQAPIFVHLNALIGFRRSLIGLNPLWKRFPNEALHAMNAWRLFAQCSPKLHVGDTSKVISQSVWDHSLAASHGFLMNKAGDGKHLDWIGGVPYFTHADLGRVRACNLHCWGPWKSKMHDLYQTSLKPT